MMTTWTEFETAVQAAGLTARRCGSLMVANSDVVFAHWQIKEGQQLVNIWPDGKRGFVFKADGAKSKTGTLADAIRLAGPSKKPPPIDTPPWEDKRDRPVGLIRRLWRWIW